MTQQADQIRNRRQHFAAPGGSLDVMVRWLAIALPAGVGAVAAMMIIAPLSPRGEISFLLDRNKVAIAQDRMRVNDAMYRGKDAQGRPFSIAAGEAVQRSVTEPVVELNNLTARLMMADGPAMLTARSGDYQINDNLVHVPGQVRFKTTDGYNAVASNVAVDLRARTLNGKGQITGEVPAGTFSANSIQADLEGRTVTLDGQARLRMVPGKLRMP